MSHRRSTEDPFERDPRKHRQSRRDRLRQESESTRDRESSTGRNRADRRKRWPFVLVAFLVVVLLLPNIIGWLGLHQRGINWALQDFQGTVNVGNASLGWFQSIELTDIAANDPAGFPLATFQKIKTDQPLYAFLTGNSYGEIDIFQPVLHVKLREDGSNLEDAAAKYIAMSQPSPLQKPDANKATEPFELPQMTLRIHEGAANIATDSSDQVWQIDSLSAVAAVATNEATNEAPLAATMQCRVSSGLPDDSGQVAIIESGTLLLKSAFDTGSQQLNFATASIDIETDQLPLSIISPLAQRVIGPSRIGGNASLKLATAWNGTSNELSTDIQSVEIANVDLVAPAMLGQDQFFFERLSARGKIGLSPSRISADAFEVETDFGAMNANGDFDPAAIATLSNGNQLLDSPLQMEGNIDLAKLIQRLPSTLRIHEDVNIESGTVQFSAGTQNEVDARRLVVNLDTANIKATRSGQPIVWQQPLRIVGVVRESDGSFSLENFQCVSDFLNINGKATMREGMFVATGDLNELSQRVGQFADLSEMQFGGTLKGEFGWAIVGDQQVNVAQLASQPLQIGGEFTVSEPVLQMAGMPRWQPAQIVIKLSGQGQLNSGNTEENGTQLQLSQAGAQLGIGREIATLSLAQPIDDAFTNPRWIFNTQIEGTVDGWLRHVRNFVDPGDIAAAGALSFAGVSILDASGLQIERGQYEIKQASFTGYGIGATEDRVVGTVTANYDFETGNIGMKQASLQGSGLSATAQDLRLTYTDAMLLDGSAAYSADINRVAQWLALSPNPDSIFWYGTAEGTVQFQSSPTGTAARLKTELIDVVATQRTQAVNSNPNNANGMQMVGNVQQAWVELWREPRINISSQLSLGSDFDSIAFEEFVARSGSVDVDATGTLSDLSGFMLADLSGNWQPNFDKLNTLLASYSYGTVTLRGNGVQPFRIQGPIFPSPDSTAYVSKELSVQTVVGWEGGSLLGIPIGKSDLNVDLQQQLATMDAVNIPLSGGNMNLRPQLDLRSAQMVLLHPESRILDNVQITPEVCRDCLKFVAPWLADTTNAQGIFTADLLGMSLPIDDPSNVSARGSLVMQDVVIAAGPMANQLLETVNQVRSILKPESRDRDLKTWLRVEQQTIPIAVENRRVYHEGIKFSHEELEIRTSGSVGFDQTINLVAKIPVAEDWIAGKSWLVGLRGQSISIPITGTVSRPIVDRNAVQKLSQQLVKDAASGAIGNAINEKLNPKVQQFQNELNGKVSGEVNKLQNKFQNKLGGFLGDKLGVPNSSVPNSSGANPSGANPSGANPSGANPNQPVAPKIEDKLENEFKRGLDKLFGK